MGILVSGECLWNGWQAARRDHIPSNHLRRFTEKGFELDAIKLRFVGIRS